MSTKPTIQSFNVLGELIIQKYERYLPTAFDESMTLLQKVNKVIEYLNQTGLLVNDVVEQWNTVMEWVMNDGLIEGVNIKLDEMATDGTLEQLINVDMLGVLANLKTSVKSDLVSAINENFDEIVEVTEKVKHIAIKPDDYTGVNDDENMSLALAENRPILLTKGKIYNFSNTINVPDNTVIFVNNATFKFNLSGNVKTFTFGDNIKFIGHLNIDLNSLVAPTGSGEFQAPISIGDYHNGDGSKNITIDSIKITSNRTTGNGVFITGDTSNIKIGNIEVPDNSSFSYPLMIHWGGAGVYQTSHTTHVHNVIIDNIKVGKNYNDGSIVFLSAPHNIKIGNIEVEECGGDVVSIFAGDYGYEYALPEVKKMAMKNIVIENVNAKLVRGGDGLLINLQPLLISGSKGYKTNLEVKRFVAYGDGSTSVGSGLHVFYTDGAKIGMIYVTGFNYGLLTQNSAKNILIEKAVSFGNRETGFSASHGTIPPENIVVKHLISFNNGTATTITNNKSGAYVGSSKGVKIYNAILGEANELTQQYGIRVDTNAVNTEVEKCHVNGVTTNGIAYSLGSGTTYGIIKTFKDNTCVDGITFKSGLLHTIAYFTPNGNKVCYGTSAPTSSTWKRGDIVINSAFSGAVGSATMWVCTADGTPGTWVGAGAVI